MDGCAGTWSFGRRPYRDRAHTAQSPPTAQCTSHCHAINIHPPRGGVSLVSDSVWSLSLSAPPRATPPTATIRRNGATHAQQRRCSSTLWQHEDNLLLGFVRLTAQRTLFRRAALAHRWTAPGSHPPRAPPHSLPAVGEPQSCPQGDTPLTVPAPHYAPHDLRT
eukprot:2650784-Prymnesium_polylepis.1